MDLVDKIVATGKSLGLEGDRLVEFVREHEVKEQKKEEEAVAREERKLERELKKSELEHLLKLEMLAKEIELEKVKAEHASATPYSSSKTDVKAKIPKLPPFNEQRDNMYAYLKRFERFAESAG